jgi:heme-degrading monooxygenase HmoA
VDADRGEEQVMYVIVQHTVRDYDAWKPVFDEHESIRTKYGAKGHAIYRSLDHPNDVTVVNRFESRQRAEEFARDPSLAEAMQRGGVIGEPRVTFAEEAESTSYAKQRAA